MENTKVAREDELEKQIRVDPRAMRACCGYAIEPRLAELRDPSGRIVFVSVWRCAYCGRATS